MATQMKTLGQLLREWRARMGFTNQAQAAVHLGVALRAYQNWERDETYPETKTLLEKILPALGLEPPFGTLGPESKGRYLKPRRQTVAA